MAHLKKQKKFRELYNLYYPLILLAVIKKCKTREDAQDICQEVFTSFYSKLEEIENHKSWLYGAARYSLSNYYQRKATRFQDTDNIEDISHNDSSSTFDESNETKILLKEILEGSDVYANEEERILFRMIALNSFTKKQVSSHLGLTRSQVEYKYKCVSKKIVEALRQKGIDKIEDLL